MVAAAVAVGTAVVGGIAASESADAQSDAARDASNAQVTSSREATQLQRDIANYSIGRTAPMARAQAEAYARQMLMQGIPEDQVIQFLEDNNAATYATLPSGTGATLGGQQGGGRLGVGGPFGAAPSASSAAPGASVPDYDSSWVGDWEYESSSPSYGYRFDEGQRALERSAAARGDLFSGGTGRELTRYGQDYASNEWEKDWRRLSELYGGGSATGDTINIATGFGQQAGQNIIGAGNARATGYLNQGNAQAAGYQGIANSISGAAGMYGQSQGWWGQGGWG